jgi:uncharacterized protein
MLYQEKIMIIPIILFASIAFFILFGAHYFVYRSALFFFPLPADIRIWLAWMLFFLGASFLASTFLAHWYDSSFSKWYYIFSAVWAGILSNIFFAFLIAKLIALVLPGFADEKSKILLGIAFLFLGLAVSIYGLWNARHPRLKYIEVQIANLPATWHGRTAVQLSDIHLGYMYGSNYMRGVAGQIKEAGPDIIFLTGDVFDGVGDNLVESVSPLKDLSPQLGKFFILGNHETYLGIDKTINAIKTIDARVLRDEIAEVDGLMVAGADYPAMRVRQSPEHLKSLLDRLDKDKPSILLNHEPIYTSLVKSAGVDLQLSGHTHNGQLWPYNIFTRLIYGKYHNGFFQENNFAINTSAGTGTWGPPMRIGNTPEITVIRFK